MIKDALEFATSVIIVGLGLAVALGSFIAILIAMFIGVMWVLS